MKTALIVVGAITYFFSPIDLAPDFIPFAGYADDFGVFIWAFNSIFNKSEVKAVEAKDDVIDVA